MSNDTVDSVEKSVGKSLATDLYNFAKRKTFSLDLSGEKMVSYIEGIASAYNKIQIMGMNEKRKLTEIYVNLRTYTDIRKKITSPASRSSSYSSSDYSTQAECGSSSSIDEATEAMGYGYILEKDRNINSVTADDSFAQQQSLFPNKGFEDSNQREDSIKFVACNMFFCI